jgi:membrane protease YdiL (CAAX protease family)
MTVAGNRRDEGLIPIGLFVLALFATTWTLPILVRHRATPDSIWPILAGLLPVVWAPTVLALVFTRWFEGFEGLRRELRARLRYQRGSSGWVMVAAVVPVAAVMIAVLAARAAGHGAPWTPAAAIPVMVGVQLMTGAVGEELGWRGYLLPRLGERLGVIRAAWLMAMLWSLWHLPAFFTPGMPHQTMPMALVLPSIVLFGLFLAFVFRRNGGSIIATVVAHLFFNIVSGLGGVQLTSGVFWGTLTGLFGVVAILVSLPDWPRRAGARPT